MGKSPMIKNPQTQHAVQIPEKGMRDRAREKYRTGKAYTREEWTKKLCEGENSLLEQKKRKIDEREAKKAATAAKKSLNIRNPKKKAPEPAPTPPPSPPPPKKKAPAKEVSVKKQVGDLLTKKFEDTTKGEDGLTKGEISKLKMAKALVNAPHISKKQKEDF